MKFTQAVRQACYDNAQGCLFVQHVEGKIAPNSDAFIAECNQGNHVGYVQVYSCEAVRKDWKQSESIVAYTARLARTFNMEIQAA